jgi:two-component system phosphate regulon sensor histidine kinase PhoR
VAAILAGMVEGVIVVDADGRMQLVNDSAREMLGVGEGAAVERYLQAIRHPEIVAQFDAAMAGREPDPAEIVLPSSTVVMARAVPLAHGGAVLVLHDISRLRQADQVRRDFVANVSHELRTPLTAIQGYAEALRDDTLAAVERERFLDIIGRHTERMTRLVQDLLRLARVESGQEPAERAPCDVAALFQTTMADLRPRIETRKQRIVTTIAPGAERLVSDPLKLEEILKNLLENAVNYAPDGSEIRLESDRRSARHELRVLDQGPGIPPADLTRVFERFYRVDKARSRESGGTGLGLSIVKHLAEKLGGTVRAENRPGGGAQFTVSLPGGVTEI